MDESWNAPIGIHYDNYATADYTQIPRTGKTLLKLFRRCVAADNVVTVDYTRTWKTVFKSPKKRISSYFFFFSSFSSDFFVTRLTPSLIIRSARRRIPSRLSLSFPSRQKTRFPGFICLLTLYIQVDRHFVAAVSVRGYAEVSRAVLSARAYKLERADYAVGRVLLLKRVPIVGKFLLQVCAHLLPKYLQGMITLRLATEGSARA